MIIIKNKKKFTCYYKKTLDFEFEITYKKLFFDNDTINVIFSIVNLIFTPSLVLKSTISVKFSTFSNNKITG